MVAVEPDSMEPGTGLTNAVADAVGTATAAVLEALAGRAEGEDNHDR